MRFPNKFLFIAFASLSLMGCSSQQTFAKYETGEVLAKIKSKYGSYKLFDHSSFKGYADGFALRFINEYEFNHHADVFVYPVPENLQKESHQDIIYRILKGSVQSIFDQVEYGFYDEVKVLSSKQIEIAGQSISVVKMTIEEKGVQNLSYLFVTEKGGELIHGRVTHIDFKDQREREDVEKQTSAIFKDLLGVL